MTQIAWGAKVSKVFLDRVKWIVEDLEIGESIADGMSKLMACIAWETGRSFSSGVVNKAGSGATGLIQFMPATAATLGTSTTALARMTAEDQLNYVWKYFQPYKGKLKSLSDLYMAILWPSAIGKPETYVLWPKDQMPTTYRQNSGLDTNKDGNVIKAEASAKLNAMLAEGMQSGNVCEYGNDLGQTLINVVTKATEVVDMTKAVTAVLPVPAIVADAVDKAKSVTETADTITTVVVEPKDTTTAVKKALSGWQGNLAGGVAILGALLLDPTFSSLLGRFTTTLASGNGRWGALAALIGAGLVVYQRRPGV